MNKTSQNSLAHLVASRQFRYYYTRLSHEMQEGYDKMLDGYLKHQDSISIKASSIDAAWEIHRALCYDVPEVFFIKALKASYNPLLSTVIVYPEYRFDYDTCLNLLGRMEEQTGSFVQRIAILSDQEKVKQIHDYIVRNVTYKDLNAPYSHESPGVLIYGIAVCEGIAKAFKYLSDRVNINSIVIAGDAFDDIQQTNPIGHAWNIVFIATTPYHVDTTFDYSVSNGHVIRYDYFLLSDRQIKRDHIFEEQLACNVCFEFYQIIGLYAGSKKTLQDLVRKKLRPGKPLVVKTPDFQEKAEKVAEKFLEIVIGAISVSYDSKLTVSLMYNDSRKVFQFELCY